MRFLKVDFIEEQASDATTLLNFRHLLEKRNIGTLFFDAASRKFERRGLFAAW